MKLAFAHTILLLPIAGACATGGSARAPTSRDDARPADAANETRAFARERELVDAARAAVKAVDLAAARAKSSEAIELLLERQEADRDEDWLGLLDAAGRVALNAQDLHAARRALATVLEIRSSALPDDHPELQSARQIYALTIRSLGDLEESRVLFEKVLEVRTRTLPEDHLDLQAARQNLAATIREMGDLRGAVALQEKALEVCERTLPDDHDELQVARGNLASSLRALGELPRARSLQERVLGVRTRTRPDDHPDLQAARGNLAATMHMMGDVQEARVLFEKVLEVRTRTLPDDHPELQSARLNLAGSIKALGELQTARILEEKVLEIRSRTLADDHPRLQAVRQNLGGTLYTLGDLQGARTLQEKVLEVRSRSLPDDALELQAARSDLAATIATMGELEEARALLEKVLEVGALAMPDDHPTLQATRGNLAVTLMSLGETQRAQELFEEVLHLCSRSLPDDHLDVQLARQNLAWALYAQGDLQGAQALQEQTLEARSGWLPDDHPDLQTSRQNLAITLVSALAGEGAKVGQGGNERFVGLIVDLCRAQVHAAREAILASPAREAEERCARLAQKVDVALSFAEGFGVLGQVPELRSSSFVLSETTRGAALASAGLTRRAAGSAGYGALRDALRAASDALAGLAQQGATSDELDRARVERESAERELVALAREVSGGRAGDVEFDPDDLAAALRESEAAVAFRRFRKSGVDGSETDSLCAFVVRNPRPDALLTLVDLGPLAPIEEAVGAWRGGLGVGSHSRGVTASRREEESPDAITHGTSLREKILDPLLPALAGSKRIVFVLDDVLHLVPIDALPLGDGALVGDRWRVETRTTLTELLREPEPSDESMRLVAFGDVDYGEGDHGFSPLPETGLEARGIARTFAGRFGADAALDVCEGAAATRERLLALAPEARFLHIATHGWFAPESERSWDDLEPLDKRSGFGMRPGAEARIRGTSPMLLCGLALAGANLPADFMGRVPGRVTADELSTFDLSNCELVTLSACDTNIGERRAGQGVASLQRAMQMAGARSAITSLWEVPDKATRELMLDFYRRLWVEKKPKGQALWEAKKGLREARDEGGHPKYSTRDWAAWVLTGDPD